VKAQIDDTGMVHVTNPAPPGSDSPANWRLAWRRYASIVAIGDHENLVLSEVWLCTLNQVDP
jgi:hypothetical protein